MKGTRLTDEIIDKIRKLYNSGMRQVEIAKKLGRSQSNVNYVLSKAKATPASNKKKESVKCKCPMCEKIYEIFYNDTVSEIRWTGNGMWRKFCKRCRDNKWSLIV